MPINSQKIIAAERAWLRAENEAIAALGTCLAEKRGYQSEHGLQAARFHISSRDGLPAHEVAQFTLPQLHQALKPEIDEQLAEFDRLYPAMDEEFRRDFQAMDEKFTEEFPDQEE